MGAIYKNSIKYSGGGGSAANERELTQAEYDLLTPEEKMNGTNYYITDGEGGGGSGGGGGVPTPTTADIGKVLTVNDNVNVAWGEDTFNIDFIWTYNNSEVESTVATKTFQELRTAVTNNKTIKARYIKKQQSDIQEIIDLDFDYNVSRSPDFTFTHIGEYHGHECSILTIFFDSSRLEKYEDTQALILSRPQYSDRDKFLKFLGTYDGDSHFSWEEITIPTPTPVSGSTVTVLDITTYDNQAYLGTSQEPATLTWNDVFYNMQNRDTYYILRSVYNGSYVYYYPQKHVSTVRFISMDQHKRYSSMEGYNYMQFDIITVTGETASPITTYYCALTTSKDNIPQ